MDPFKENVDVYCMHTGVTRRELAEKMHIPYSTFLSKLNGPSEFSFSEGSKLAELIGRTADQMRVSPVTNGEVA